MLRRTIVLMVALAIAGCRTGFPSLSGGLETAPAVLYEAKSTVPENASQLQQEKAAMTAVRAEVEQDSLDRPTTLPRKLLAALPLAYAETLPNGVIGRAVESAQASNRSLIVVGVGVGAEAAVSALAAAMEARGVQVRQEISARDADTPSRVDLYLGA